MGPEQCDDRRCTSPATHETTLVSGAAGAPEVLRAQLCDEHELTDDDQIVRLDPP